MTLGNIVVKATARKVRRLYHDKVLAGFAGATADAFTLFERFEAKLEKHQGHLVRSAIELTKDWRTDRVLRRLEAMLAVADHETSLIITGNGDVLEPEYGIVAIGSGGSYASAAARALLQHTELAPQGHRQAVARDRRRSVHLHEPEPHDRDAGLMAPDRKSGHDARRRSSPSSTATSSARPAPSARSRSRCATAGAASRSTSRCAARSRRRTS